MPNDEIVRRIRAAKPDVLLVSFGCPKAEEMDGGALPITGSAGGDRVGGTIDFWLGT